MGRNWYWILILILTSCLKDVKPGQHHVFTIPKGDHYSIKTLKKYNRDLLTFAFRFDNSAIYDLGDNDQYDTNKLIGYKYGLDPHKNSVRFGWKWSIEDDYIVIVAYSYVDGVRDIYDIGYCFPNQIYSAEIEETTNSFIYRFQGQEYVISKTKNSGNRNYLFPYFGGDKKAPHDIFIEIWF